MNRKHLTALVLVTIMALVLQGCATYSVEKIALDGSVIRADIKTLWHDVEALEAGYESDQGAKLNVAVGRMGSNSDINQAICLLFPHLCE